MKNLTADTLGELDGGTAREIINAGLQTAIADLDDRGHDAKPREVIIKLTMVKSQGVSVCDVQVKTNLPAYRSNNTVGLLSEQRSKTGRMEKLLSFQEHNPENPSQPTFAQMAEGEIPNE